MIFISPAKFAYAIVVIAIIFLIFWFFGYIRVGLGGYRWFSSFNDAWINPLKKFRFYPNVMIEGRTIFRAPGKTVNELMEITRRNYDATMFTVPDGEIKGDAAPGDYPWVQYRVGDPNAGTYWLIKE
jgi:hypothetical protein